MPALVHRVVLVVLLVFTVPVLGGCPGGPDLDRPAVGTVSALRGTVAVDDVALPPAGRRRVGEGERVSVSDRGPSLLVLDGGARLWLDEGASVRVLGGGRVRIEAGRVLAETSAAAALTVLVGNDRNDESDEAAAASGPAFALAPESAANVVRGDDGAQVRGYVLRGELGVRRGDRLVARVAPGDEVTVATGADADAEGPPDVAPMFLWDDWTGGMAAADPRERRPPPGVGVLEARVPGETGQARWPMVLERVDVQVRLEGDLAITEVDQRFFNPASEAVEGRYRLRIPDRALLQRFAVDRDGRLVDGVPKEQAQAKRAYEAQVYRGSTDDPALLEWTAPGSYEARIYPIAAGATRRIVVRYAEWLPRPASADDPVLYRFRLGEGRAMPRIAELSFEAEVARDDVRRVRASEGAVVADDGHVRLRESDVVPAADLWLELHLAGDAATATGDALVAYRAAHARPPRAPGSRTVPDEDDEADYLLVPVTVPDALLAPPAGAESAGPGLDLVVVADLSAGTDPAHLELGRATVEALLAHLDEDDRFALVGADLALRPLRRGDDAMALAPASAPRIEAMLEGLAQTPGGGGTDLAGVLTQAREILDPSRPGAVIYVGDGAPTVGALDAAGLLDAVEGMPSPLRLYALGIGSEANLDLLATLTGGGGLARRVADRQEAAGTALEVLAHAARPVLQRATVTFSPQVEGVFPRRPIDLVAGSPFAVTARLPDGAEAPRTLTLRGTVAGRETTVAWDLEIAPSPDRVDPRLRWATARLRRLLLDGGTREEVVDLGLRYGVLTPYTSLYVPSARELRLPGWSALLPGTTATHGFPDRLGGPSAWVGALAAVVLSPLTLAGCDALSAPEEQAAMEPPSPAAEDGPSPAPPGADPAAETERRHARGRLEALASSDRAAKRESPGAAYAPDEEVAAGGADDLLQAVPGGIGGTVANESEADGLDLRGSGRGGGGGRGSSAAAAPGPAGSRQSGNLGSPILEGGARAGGGLSALLGDGAAVGGEADGPEATGETGVDAEKAAVPADRRARVVVSTTVEIERSPHLPRRCSEASRLPVDDRVTLWGERLAQPDSGSWRRVYREAKRLCELRGWRDRRAFLGLVLDRAGGVPGMLRVYDQAYGGPLADVLRKAILRRVRTAGDLQRVRAAFGLSRDVQWDLVEDLLERAGGPAERVAVLEELLLQYPDHPELTARLLAAYEAAGMSRRARRLADRLRADPATDPGLRTAIGELYLRLGDEAEARRALSEMVEFAPRDPSARRRLGDVYRAHGWYDDAYRQYETLAVLRPDDLTVLLLMAQAAAGAGRVDEALRLEQRVTETAEPGRSRGLARTALLWSSVRFARLRHDAREGGDGKRLDGLTRRLRRSGVLREARPFRVALVWSHPDADVGLWVQPPTAPAPTRPGDLAPALGIEAYEDDGPFPGPYRLEIRRSLRDDRFRGPLDAELLLLFDEGGDDELVLRVPLRFEGDRDVLAFVLDERTLTPDEGDR